MVPFQVAVGHAGDVIGDAPPHAEELRPAPESPRQFLGPGHVPIEELAEPLLGATNRPFVALCALTALLRHLRGGMPDFATRRIEETLAEVSSRIFELAGGTLGGAGNFTVPAASQFNWMGGTLGTGGVFSVAAGGNVVISGAATSAVPLSAAKLRAFLALLDIRSSSFRVMTRSPVERIRTNLHISEGWAGERSPRPR